MATLHLSGHELEGGARAHRLEQRRVARHAHPRGDARHAAGQVVGQVLVRLRVGFGVGVRVGWVRASIRDRDKVRVGARRLEEEPEDVGVVAPLPPPPHVVPDLTGVRRAWLGFGIGLGLRLGLKFGLGLEEALE